jgi:diguanylate cyclase (GGDEF)-like protein/PAS domain S-box-containing protein
MTQSSILKRKAEAATGSSSEWLDSSRLLDNLPAMVAYFDSGLRFCYANRNYALRHGSTPQQLIGRHCEEFLTFDNRELLIAHLNQALGGEGATFTYDLAGLPVQADYAPDIRADGSIAGVIASLTILSQPSDLQSHIIASRAMFGDAFEQSPIGMAVVDTLGRVVRANNRFCDMLGRSQAELADIPFSEITHPDDINADMMLFGEVLAGSRDGYKIDKRYLRGDGAIVEAALTVSAIRNRAGEILRFISQIEDVTEQRQAERKLVESHAQLTLAMEAVPGGFWHMDIGSRRFETSERLAKFISGRDGEKLTLQDYLAQVPMEDRAGTDLGALIEGRVDRSSAEYRLDTVNGRRWIRCDRRLLRDAYGDPYAIVGVAIDFTKERQELLHSQQEAHTDALTGLLNRRGLAQHFKDIADRSSIAVLAVDLDGFKSVNDTIGHDAGDAVLVDTAAKLRSVVRSGDLVARLGGDEFAVILQEADQQRLEDVAQRINETLRRALTFGNATIVVRGSLGGILSSRRDAALVTLLTAADERLYKAKAAGKDTAWVAS